MRCRGQITVFALIAVVLLLITLIFVLFSSSQITPVQIDKEVDNIPGESFELAQVQNCAETSAKYAIQQNGFKGGLYDPENFIFGVTRPPITKHYINTWETVPAVNQLEESVGKEFLTFFDSCLFEIENNENIRYSSGTVEVTLANENVYFSIDYPVTILYLDEQETIDSFSHVEQNVRIEEILSVSEQIAQIQKESPNDVCISCLIELGDKHFMNINVEDVGDGVVVYHIIDLLSLIDGEPYQMQVAYEI